MYVDNDGGVYVGDLLVAEIKDPTVKAVIDPAVQYTRRGDFHIKVEGDDQAYLVSVDGFHVQGQGGSISFPKQTTPDQIIIDTRGRVFLDQGPKKKMKQIDQLRISKMTDIDFKGKLKFSLDEHNFVVTPRGRPIHDIHGHFILAPEGTGSIDVTPDGRVMADGLEIARTWERPGKVQRGEDEPVVVQTRFGYYVPADEFVAVNDVACNVHQCNLEQSNVNVISELGQMIITMRSFEADARLLQAMEQNLRLVTNPNA
jgi:flagellar basal body rod protein FlgG